MFEFDFKFDASGLERAIMKTAAEDIMKRVSNMRCPEHAQYAHIVARGRSSNDMSFDVSGCCDKFIDTVKRKL